MAGVMPRNSTSCFSCNDSSLLDRGDFVDSDHEGDIEAESVDTMEHFNNYFYPVRIGDIFNERYEVIHKLGSIVDCVGTLPLEWTGYYNSFDKDAVHESWYGNASGSQSKDRLSEILDQHHPNISANEKALALSVIREVFHPMPEDRNGAAELLENEYLKALMRLYGF